MDQRDEFDRRVSLLLNTMGMRPSSPFDPLVVAAETAAYVDLSDTPLDQVQAKVEQLLPPHATLMERGLSVIMTMALPSMRAA